MAKILLFWLLLLMAIGTLILSSLPLERLVQSSSFLDTQQQQIEISQYSAFNHKPSDQRPLTEFTIQHPNKLLSPFSSKPPQFPAIKWNSQFGEDKHLYLNFFRDFKFGSFVELGAVDGLHLSNTRAFQDSLNWTGVLIEPSPSTFEKLRKSYRCRAGGAICLKVAICKNFEFAQFLGTETVSGIEAEMTKEHRHMWFGFRKKPTIPVPCAPMSHVMDISGIKRIDFFSIDVEGAELNVVDTFDWNAIPVYLVLLERISHGVKEEMIDRILTMHGFQYFGDVGVSKGQARSVIWVNPKNIRQTNSADSYVAKY